MVEVDLASKGMETDVDSYPRMAEELEGEDLSASDIEGEVQCPVCAQVFMDPMTLSCGHSFCQICLARLWKSEFSSSQSRSSGTLLCPACRHPWGQMPQINIQLRNIVESMYKESMNERRQNLTTQDQMLLDSFSKARVRRARPLGQDLTPLVKVMLVLFLILGVCAVVATVIVLWVWTGASGEFMRKPVSVWRSEDVLAWVEGLGEWTVPNITRLFQIQALTGPQLLLVDDQTLVEFGVEQQFRRQTILQAVDQLRAEEFSQPLDFYQFKAAHRRTTLLLALFYSSWPRLTLLYSYLFEYYPVFLPLSKAQFSTPLSQAQLSWLQSSVLCGLFLLFPHVGVCVLCVEWVYTHPWICVPVLVHCAVAMTTEVLALFNTRQRLNQMKSKVMSAGGEVLKFCVWTALYHVLWPFIPHFVCDFLLYMTLWNTAVMYLIVKPVKHFYK